MGLAGFVASVLGSIVSALLVAEFHSWRPWLSKTFLNIAVRRLPKDLSQRLDEEWSAYLDEIPGEVGKLLVSVGFVFASEKIRCDMAFARYARFFQSFEQCIDLYWRLKGIVIKADKNQWLSRHLKRGVNIRDLDNDLAVQCAVLAFWGINFGKPSKGWQKTRGGKLACASANLLLKMTRNTTS